MDPRLAKRPRIDDDVDDMQVDSATTGNLISVKPQVNSKQILVGLRPILWNVMPYTETKALINALKKVELFQISDDATCADIKAINARLAFIYKSALQHAAWSEVKVDHTEIEDSVRHATLELCIALQQATLHDINGSDIKVYSQLIPNLEDEEEGAHKRIIIRPEDESFWGKCVELSSNRHPVCGVGNPGIGKTTTTIYLLQQLLMKRKVPVVYTICSVDTTSEKEIQYEFIPEVDNGKIIDIKATIYRLPEAEVASKVPSMKLDNAFCVVDPGISNRACYKSHKKFKANFIMAASNDKRHWGEGVFLKLKQSETSQSYPLASNLKKDGVHVYGSLWTGTQLVAAKPYISAWQGLDDDEILRRFRIVGGSMRDMLGFNENKFKNSVMTALGGLNDNTVRQLYNGRYEFAFEQNSPSSILIAIAPDEDDSTDYTVALKSDFVEECFARNFLKISWFEVADEGNASNRGNLFESYVRSKFSMGQVELSEDDVRESCREKPKQYLKNYRPLKSGMTIGSKRGIVRASNMVDAVKKDSLKQSVFYSRNEREPLIDMIWRVDGGYDAIQATIRKDHGAAVEKIQNLVSALQLKEGERLRIFYCVPSCRYEGFATAPVNPLLAKNVLDNVSIYHVRITSDE